LQPSSARSSSGQSSIQSYATGSCKKERKDVKKKTQKSNKKKFEKRERKNTIISISDNDNDTWKIPAGGCCQRKL
jgi:hypothetical protein